MPTSPTDPRRDIMGNPMPPGMLDDEAWRLGEREPNTDLLIVSRLACTDGRYSWLIEGPCPCSTCTGAQHLDAKAAGWCYSFEVTREPDPDVMVPALLHLAVAECPCHLASPSPR
jgi:hypothetical protein